MQRICVEVMFYKKMGTTLTNFSLKLILNEAAGDFHLLEKRVNRNTRKVERNGWSISDRVCGDFVRFRRKKVEINKKIRRNSV